CHSAQAALAVLLEEQHPEWVRDINVVHSVLERLVAKSRIERTKQKETVLYTAVDGSAALCGTTCWRR
ncbi:hypothetical protein ACFT0E_12605, partial [Streptomyces sp. NPDC057052]